MVSDSSLLSHISWLTENSSTRRLHHAPVYACKVLMYLVKSAVFCISFKQKNPMVLCFNSLQGTVPKSRICFLGLHSLSLFSVKSVFDFDFLSLCFSSYFVPPPAIFISQTHSQNRTKTMTCFCPIVLN